MNIPTIYHGFIEKQCFDVAYGLIQKVIEIQRNEPFIDICGLLAHKEVQKSFEKLVGSAEYLAKECAL